MRRNLVIASAAVALIVVAGAAIYLLRIRDTGEQAQAGQPSVPPTSTGTSAVPANQAHDVALALRALGEDPGSLVASSSRAQVGDRVLKGVPPGSTVVPDEASWAPDGVGGGVIAVSLRSPGLPTTDFAVVMVLESGHWKVAATVPISEQPPASGGPTR